MCSSLFSRWAFSGVSFRKIFSNPRSESPDPDGAQERRAHSRTRVRAAGGPAMVFSKPPGAGPGDYIGTKGKDKLKKYKYNVVDRSIIAPYLQPWWTRFIEFVPLWVAPNAVTCIGEAGT